MNMPPDILTFLLRGGILNVDERKAKGLWPNEKLRYSEVLDHLASVIQRRSGFHGGCPTTSPAIWFTKEQSFSESRLRASYVTAGGHLFTIFIPLRRTHRSNSTKQKMQQSFI